MRLPAPLAATQARLSFAVRRALVRAPEPVASLVAGLALRRFAPLRMVDPAKLARIRPELSDAERDQLRRALYVRAMRTLMAQTFARHGEWDALRELIRLRGFERLPDGGAVLLNWHLGAAYFLRHALRLAGRPPFVIAHDTTVGDHDDIGFVGHGADPSRRAAVALEAYRRLRAGGVVQVMGDGEFGERPTRVPVLGFTPSIQPGAATLAHLARVPVHPINAAWRDGVIDLEIEPALDLPYAASREELVRVMAETIGAWLDRYLRREPLALTAFHAHWLVR